VAIVTPLRLGDCIETRTDCADAPAGTRLVVTRIAWLQAATGWIVSHIVGQAITPPLRGHELTVAIPGSTWRAVARDAGWTVVQPTLRAWRLPEHEEPVHQHLRSLA
jgi:hypothetical protein